MTVGEKIKLARTKAKLSQKRLGEMVGVSQQAIGQFETGKTTPTLNTLQRISAVLESDNIMQLYWDDTILDDDPLGIKYQEMIEEEENSFFNFLVKHGMNVYSEYSEDNFIQHFVSFDNSTYIIDFNDWSELHDHIFNITKEVIRAVGNRVGVLGRSRWDNRPVYERPDKTSEKVDDNNDDLDNKK